MKKIALIVTSLLLSTQIHADGFYGCVQSDLNGEYVTYQNSVALVNLHTGKCMIKIQAGQATGTCAFNVTSNGAVVPGFSGVVTGSAVINSNCSVNMELDFSPAANVTVKSYFDLQFSTDKQSFIGQWTNNFGLLGTSSGTRYASSLPNTPTPDWNKGRNEH